MSSKKSKVKEPLTRIYRPGPNIKEKLQSLKSAISNRPPFCTGTVPVASSDLFLFYGKPTGKDVAGRATARCLDLTNATETDMQELVDVCDAATFGLNHEDVLDVSYRSAWKLDPVYFASKLNIVHAGLMDSIRYNLLQGDQGRTTFYAELYKLNVYGKGSFFKPHKDTPRGEKMFGSLVIVLSTAHEGGTLILRHGGEEWKFESDRVPPTSISYAAFYGDVEHEVAEVTSGYRLTLTYNLYFDESLDSQAIVSTPTLISSAPTPLPPNAGSFQDKLSELLSDDTFLPMGGRLGFGLFHEYPFESEPKLERIAAVLKGSDATLMQACRALGLTCVLNVCYQDENDEDRAVALCDYVPKLGSYGYVEDALWEYVKLLGSRRKVIVANSDSDQAASMEAEEIDLKKRGGRLPEIDVFVHWVTKQTSYNAFESHFIKYGNQASLSHDYGRVCLIVSVGPPDRRGEEPAPI